MTTQYYSEPTSRIGLVLIVMWTVVTVGCGDTAFSPRQATTAPGESITAEELLAKVRAKYVDAESYSDNAILKQRGVNRSRGAMTEVPFTYLSLLFERPNRYTITYEDALPGSQGKTSYRVVSDGMRIRSSASQLPEQIHEAIAPRVTTVDNLIPEPELRSAILQVAIENLFPQLVMLLSGSTEKPIFPRASRMELLPEKKIDTTTCYRLNLNEPEGTRVIWIDKKTMLLKRMEIPIEGQRKALDPSHEYISYSVDIDFENVTLDAEFAEPATELEVPKGGRLVRRFIPPPPSGPSESLGKPVKGYQFSDLNGEPVTAASLAGKIVVFDFWATDCAPCKEGIAPLEEAYQQLKDDDNVAFFGVSTDPKGLPNANVEGTLRAWGATFPVLRDLDKNAFYGLNVQATPTLLVIGPDNRLQASHLGPLKDAEDLVKKVRQLLDGKNLIELARQEYAEELKRYDAILDAATLATSLIGGEPVYLEIGPQHLPKRLKVQELWKTKLANLGEPSDVAVLRAPNGEPQEVLVLDSGKAVVRYSAAGEHQGRVELPQHEEYSGGFIRTVAVAGTRMYLVSGAGWQQVFLYDKDWKLELAFPDDPHSGIGDAEFFAPTTDGAPMVVVGYWGGRGVEAGSLGGQRQWVNHFLDHVIDVTTARHNGAQNLSLWFTSTRGTVMEIDATGKSQREFSVPGHTMVKLLPHSDKAESLIYGLSQTSPSHYELIAFDDKGEVSWQYALPVGDYRLPIPPIQTVSLGNDQYSLLVAAPNGALAFVSLDGNIIDNFDYGSPIAGLAAVPSNEGTILLVSAGNCLSAWRITADSAP